MLLEFTAVPVCVSDCELVDACDAAEPQRDDGKYVCIRVLKTDVAAAYNGGGGGGGSRRRRADDEVGGKDKDDDDDGHRKKRPRHNLQI